MYDNEIENDDERKLLLENDFLEMYNEYRSNNNYYNIFNLNKSNDLLKGIINNKFDCDEKEIYSKVIRIEKIGNIILHIYYSITR